MASKELNKENYKISNSYDIWRKIPPNKPNKSFEEIKNKSLYKLSRKWAEESSNTQEIVEKAKQFFQKLYLFNKSGLMNNDSYDDFLFRKKKGFCEHFAGSFALLMRYADIPVRVVIGYQGGEFMTDSQNNKFFLIDNSFAHAWNEIWIIDKGWVRVDPTSWVSPERIQESSLLGNRSNTRFIKRSTFNLNLTTNVTKLELTLTS